MNVTVVCDVLGEENNGTTIAAMNLIRSLRSKGHTVNILCPDADRKGEEGYYVVPTFNLGPLNGYVRKNGVTIAKKDDAIILEAIKDADIVHVMMPFSLGERSAYLAKLCGKPLSAGFHVMSENFTTHILMRDKPLVNRVTYAFFSRLYRRCDAIHYPTQFLRDMYEGMYGPTNGYVISNSVNERFRPIKAERPAKYDGKFVIVSTGRYSREKSHELLIDAAAESKYSDRIQLVFAGSGPRLNALRRRSAKLASEPVFSFFGRDELLQILNYADLYVHPAEIEAEGIACLEAMSCGLVPVISDSPRCATKVYAMDGRNLFRYDSPRDLAEKIDWWLEHPDERAERGRKYAEFSRQHFDQRVCMDRMEEMLLETVEQAYCGYAAQDDLLQQRAVR